MTAYVWLWTCGWAVFYAGGEYLAKRWSVGHSIWWAVGCLASYLCCATCWLPALRSHGGLAVLGTLYAALAACITLLIGWRVFGEPITLRHWIGIGLACAAVVLLGD